MRNNDKKNPKQSIKPLLTKTAVSDKPLATASEQYFGYSLQFSRLLAELLTCKSGDIISFEFIDDIGIHSTSSTIVKQVKSSLSARNPLSNRASDLWKTLSNWVDLLKAGMVDSSKTKFVI